MTSTRHPDIGRKILLLFFLGLIITQVLYIRASLSSPSQLVHIIYKDTIPRGCSLGNYEKLTADLSQYVYETNGLLGKKTIALATFGGDVISVIVPMRQVSPNVFQHIRLIVMDYFRRGPELSQPCYSEAEKQSTLKDPSLEKHPILPMIGYEVRENNTHLKILDWAALALNVSAIGFIGFGIGRQRRL